MAGSEDLRLPDGLRDAVNQHLADLREGFKRRGWGARSGFGERPAVIVIDLAKAWTNSAAVLGSDLETVMDNTCRILEAARERGVPIIFTVTPLNADDPISPMDLKKPGNRASLGSPDAAELDPRLGRRPNEKVIAKKYRSSFKGTNLHDMLATLRVDTLIVTGCSTSHCVYDTCSDAASSLHVIVPKEAIGDRCELAGLVALQEIDLMIGDVMPVDEVIGYLKAR